MSIAWDADARTKSLTDTAQPPTPVPLSTPVQTPDHMPHVLIRASSQSSPPSHRCGPGQSSASLSWMRSCHWPLTPSAPRPPCAGRSSCGTAMTGRRAPPPHSSRPSGSSIPQVWSEVHRTLPSCRQCLSDTPDKRMGYYGLLMHQSDPLASSEPIHMSFYIATLFCTTNFMIPTGKKQGYAHHR